MVKGSNEIDKDFVENQKIKDAKITVCDKCGTVFSKKITKNCPVCSENIEYTVSYSWGDIFSDSYY